MGTALAPIYTAHAQGKRVDVFADETRPLLQGARITCWELQQAGVPVTLITDGMAARVMAEGRIQAVIVGSDRITRGGDVCNKIGTFGVALAARHHEVPFHVAAPLSTIDTELLEGKDIPIEERAPDEVGHGFGRRTAPEGVRIYNPAFDVTPRDLVTSIITEVGVIERPTWPAWSRHSARVGGCEIQRGERARPAGPACARPARPLRMDRLRRSGSIPGRVRDDRAGAAPGPERPGRDRGR